MAWNGSNSAGASVPAPKKPAKKSPGLTHGLIAGGAIVLIGIISLYFVTSEPDESPVEKKTPIQIAEVEPEISTATGERIEEKTVEKKPFWLVDASETNGFSEIMLHKWRDAHRPKPTHTNSLESIRHRAKSSIFKYRSENMIAAYLTIEPGQGMIGTPIMRGVTEDFLKSCEEPIVIDEKDDEFSRNLKTAMKEMKVELRQRMSDGEKLEDILLNTHKEIQRLSEYRSTLQSEFIKYRDNPEHTDEDVVDFIKAANTMLEQKGVAPISVGPITRNRLKHLLSDGEKTVEQ